MKNQSAFPVSAETISTDCGLTKLEYFAGLAMQGIVSSNRDIMFSADWVAEWSIKYAKELIKQLENDIQ